jgi:alkyldihydroxyacetonephosphate synthase
MTQPRLKHFGWGREGEGSDARRRGLVLGRITQQFGPPGEREVTPPRLEEIKLAPPGSSRRRRCRSARPRTL